MSTSGKKVLNKTKLYDRLQEKVSSIIILGLKEHMPEELAKGVVPDMTWKISDAVSSLFGDIDFTQK